MAETAAIRKYEPVGHGRRSHGTNTAWKILVIYSREPSRPERTRKPVPSGLRPAHRVTNRGKATPIAASSDTKATRRIHFRSITRLRWKNRPARIHAGTNIGD